MVIENMAFYKSVEGWVSDRKANKWQTQIEKLKFDFDFD